MRARRSLLRQVAAVRRAAVREEGLKDVPMLYTQTLIDHFANPRNVGELADADGVGEVRDPTCGDFLRIWIKVEDEHIADIKFKCKGCPAAIATASVLTEMAKGKHVDEAAEITDEKIAEAIGGLPLDKMHCSNIGAEALWRAIEDYILRPVTKKTTSGAEDQRFVG